MPPIAKKSKVSNSKDSDEEIKGKDVISAQLQKKLDRKAKDNRGRLQRGIVLVRHLPHGFFEDQLKSYFEQFGHVTRLRLARSRKNGNAKGFAFIEFAVPEVAKVAAEAMDNYLMFKKIVHAHYIPPEKQKFNYFKKKLKQVTTPLGKNIFISGKTKLARYKVMQNNKWNQSSYEKRTINTIKKINKIKKKYGQLEVNLDDIIIAPKLLPVFKAIVDDESEEQVSLSVNTSQEQPEDNQPGSLLLIKKRKRNLNVKRNVKAPKLKETLDKRELKHLDLDKILEYESTSEDEDCIPSIAEKELIINDLKQLNEISDVDEENDLDINNSINALPVQKYISKSKKHQNGDKLEKIIKRAPLLGGIIKQKNLNSKSTQKKTTNLSKNKLKISEAKKIINSTKHKN